MQKGGVPCLVVWHQLLKYQISMDKVIHLPINFEEVKKD